jgi:hypothetical protein
MAEHDASLVQGSKMFGTAAEASAGANGNPAAGAACALPKGTYDGLDASGSPIVMQQEMAKELASKAVGSGGGKKGGKKGGTKGGKKK